MKKGVMATALTLTLAIGVLTACGGQKAETKPSAAASTDETGAGESDDLLAKIQEKGTMTIAMEGNWQPWTYEDENGELAGFEVEVSAAVCEKLGVEPE